MQYHFIQARLACLALFVTFIAACGGGGESSSSSSPSASSSTSSSSSSSSSTSSSSTSTSSSSSSSGAPVVAKWKSIDIGAAAGSTGTNEDNDAVILSGQGKFESGAQTFRFVYTEITGDFTFTARVDSRDFAGLTNAQGRVGLLLAPDLTTSTTAFVFGGSTVTAAGTYLRIHRLASGSNAGTSTMGAPAITDGELHLKLIRAGNTYRAAYSRDGGATWGAEGSGTFTGTLPDTLNVGFVTNSSGNAVLATSRFTHVEIRDGSGTLLVGPNEFYGDIADGSAGTGSSSSSSGGTSTSSGGTGSTSSGGSDNSQGTAPSAPPAATGSIALYNIEGYAAASVTGGGGIAESDAAYRKVTNATEFVAALRAAKATTNPTKVIEIMNDLNLGWNEIGATAQADGLIRQNKPASKHPTLLASGVSLIDIKDFNGLTIFSKNGATIRHAELNVKDGSNIIIRNLKFDELWEWDEATKGDYDSNDWDFITVGDGGATSGVWIDHCTFTKSYDGLIDVKKGANGITISWIEVIPGDTGPGSFIRAQFDALETNRAGNGMYDYLRNHFTQEQIIQIATPQKKGHLIGANSLKEPSTYTVTLHHNHYKDMQDRMPRLRSGDVHAYNLYVDNSNAHIVKKMRDDIVNANATLKKDLDGSSTSSPKYKFGITSNGAISTEGGAIEIEKSVFYGILTPLRNNQTDPSDSAYTGAIRAIDVQHILFASDTAYMPLASQQSTFSEFGHLWASWQGDSGAANSTLGPAQATQIPFAWRNGAPAYTTHKHQVSELKALLTGAQGAGAGKVGLTVEQWLKVSN